MAKCQNTDSEHQKEVRGCASSMYPFHVLDTMLNMFAAIGQVKTAGLFFVAMCLLHQWMHKGGKNGDKAQQQFSVTKTKTITWKSVLSRSTRQVYYSLSAPMSFSQVPLAVQQPPKMQQSIHGKISYCIGTRRQATLICGAIYDGNWLVWEDWLLAWLWIHLHNSELDGTPWDL